MTAMSTGITEDAFLGDKLTICQPETGYRAGIDAVLLAASVPARSDGTTFRVLDTGAGVGTVGLSIAARIATAHTVLLERESELAALARINIGRNGLADRVRVVEAEVGAAPELLASAGLWADSFDHVVANPPYHGEGRGTLAPDPLKAASHAMPDGGLDDWLRFMARMAKPGGQATLIHKADALGEALAAFGKRFGGLRIQPIQPFADEPAHRIIVRGTKGSRAPSTLLPPVVLHQRGGGYCSRIEAIVRDGGGLSLDPASPASTQSSLNGRPGSATPTDDEPRSGAVR